MRAAVLGSPIGHSLSPALHRAAYAALGLPWEYDAVDVVPADLRAFLDGLGPEWAGLSLTMPLKQAVLPLLTTCSHLAVATGAANTVVLHDGERHGHNTDVAGIVEALREAGLTTATRGAVLGGGATAASAVAALAALGCSSVHAFVRAPGRAGPLREAAERLGVTLLVAPLKPRLLSEPLDVVVSTTPAGALDALARVVELPEQPPLLLDVVYDPWPTPLAAAFARAHATVVPGAALLLHQAAAQVELMTGQPAPVEAMRAALKA